MGLALSLALASSCFSGTADRPRAIILISVDTLRADHLSCYGYGHMNTPAIDSLARSGVLFTEHLSTVPLTLPSHCSMLTGLYPPHHGVRDNGGFYLDENVETLAERLKQVGYRTGGFIGSFVLDSRWGVAQGFDLYADEFDLIAAGNVPMDMIQRPAEDVIGRARAFMEQPGPFFCFIHIYDPHTPYEPPAAYRRQTPTPLYDGEIAAVDAAIGRLLGWLEDRRILEDALIVFTSDHGESLGEHGEATHGFFVYRSTLRVPLIMKLPGRKLAGTRRDTPSSSVDITPTILAAAGLTAALDGVDLLSSQPADRLLYSETFFPRYHYNWSELLSVSSRGLHFIDAPKPEIYNVIKDPGEALNVHTAEAARPFCSILDSLGARRAQDPQPIDADTLEKLRALGYAGGDLPLAQGPLPDPKDRIHVFNRIKQAEDLVYNGREVEAIPLLEGAVAADASIPAIFSLLGAARARTDSWDKAADAYARAVVLAPDNPEALFGLGLALKRLGKGADAARHLEHVLDVDSRNNKAAFHLAEIRSDEGRHEDAVGLLEKAVTGGREAAPLYSLLARSLTALGREGEAEQALRNGLALDAHLPLAHFNLAVLLEQRGRAEEAEVEYRRELEIEPTAKLAAFNLARLLEKRGSGKEAVDLYRRAIAADERFARAYIFLARRLMEDPVTLVEAYDKCRKGLELATDDNERALAYFVLADVCSRLGRDEEAMKALQEGRKLSGR